MKTATVVDLRESIRARVSRMANEQVAMQELMPSIPPSKIKAFTDRMEAHAIELSRLASMLEENAGR